MSPEYLISLVKKASHFSRCSGGSRQSSGCRGEGFTLTVAADDGWSIMDANNRDWPITSRKDTDIYLNGEKILTLKTREDKLKYSVFFWELFTASIKYWGEVKAVEHAKEATHQAMRAEKIPQIQNAQIKLAKLQARLDKAGTKQYLSQYLRELIQVQPEKLVEFWFDSQGGNIETIKKQCELARFKF